MVKQKHKINKEKLETNYDRYKQELEKLELKYNGNLNPKDIVREANNSKSPLHDWFDWSDSVAGEKWRTHQARMLLASIKVRIDFGDSFKEYKKYLNVQVEVSNNGSDTKRFYVSSDTAMQNEEMRKQILLKAIKEVEYWKRTYEDYKELEDSFKGIERTRKKLIKKKILVNA